MRVFKGKSFVRFAKKEGITDAKLVEAIKKAEKGSIDADYGGGVIKQRIARPGQGKSGGYRSIILFRKGELAFFAYGFAKNERDNIDNDEERSFKKLAKVVLAFSDEALKTATDSGTWTEVQYEDEKDDENCDEKDGKRADK
jgi:hypothetical protein